MKHYEHTSTVANWLYAEQFLRRYNWQTEANIIASELHDDYKPSDELTIAFPRDRMRHRVSLCAPHDAPARIQPPRPYA